MQTEQTRPLNISQKPLISFIVTTYDLPCDMLRECLMSITGLSLSTEEREIILVDDGSAVSPTNELADIIDNIIYLRQRNSGLSAARNLGLKIASGTYIQFVDGDDVLLRAPYEHCLDIARYENPDMVLFKSTDKEISATPFSYDKPVTGSQYMHNNNLRAAAWGYIFRASILGELRFTPGLLHEDEEFTPLLMLRAETVFSTNAEAYHYRRRSGSITQTTDKNNIRKRLNDMERIILHLRDTTDKIPDSDKPALNRRIAQLTSDYIFNTIKLTRSAKELDATIERLEQKGLFPLPDKSYTQKYKYFSKMLKNKILRRVLIMILPR